MKKALEAVLVVAVLGAAAALALQWNARRQAARDAAMGGGPAARAGSDAAPGVRPTPLPPDQRGVSYLPMVKMSPGQRRRAGVSAPPPPPPAR